MHISSSYAKILGETKFKHWEFPRSGSKAKDVKEILQGLGVAQAAVTEKNARKSPSFVIFLVFTEKSRFSGVFHLFIASVRSQPPGLPLVPGVFGFNTTNTIFLASGTVFVEVK